MSDNQNKESFKPGFAKDGRPIINIDLDSVVYPFLRVFAEYLDKNGISIPRNEDGSILYTQWAIWNDWDMSEEEFTKWFRQSIKDGVLWYEGEAVDGSSENMWKLSDDEYYIRILTHRLVHHNCHKWVVEGTNKWLEEKKIPYRSLMILGSSDSKANCTAMALVDDSVSNVREAAKAGQVGILFDTPANKDEEVNAEQNIYRARNWDEVYKLVRKHVPSTSS